jgi:hypothetical protein
MGKDIAVVSYDTNPASSLTADAVVMRDLLNANGYSAVLVHQWAFNEPNTATFKLEREWDKYDGIVIAGFYASWTLRELIMANRPVLCANGGYCDDLGLGEGVQEHISEDNFTLVNNTHPITTGLPLGAYNNNTNVFLDSISTFNHHVDVLINTLAGRCVLAAHKTHPLTYWAWYRMSQTTAGSPLQALFLKAANWTFSGS